MNQNLNRSKKPQLAIDLLAAEDYIYNNFIKTTT